MVRVLAVGSSIVTEPPVTSKFVIATITLGRQMPKVVGALIVRDMVIVPRPNEFESAKHHGKSEKVTQLLETPIRGYGLPASESC
jgi:hypothetical protein